ncbi:MAG: hypothetical protein JXR78_02945, partial [Victivallales bacterium]|nr:hypothetical protein [Victivallales bacterium]
RESEGEDYFQIPIYSKNIQDEDGIKVLKTIRGSKNILPPGVAAPAPECFRCPSANTHFVATSVVPGGRIMRIGGDNGGNWKININPFKADVNFANHFRTKYPAMLFTFYARSDKDDTILKFELSGLGQMYSENQQKKRLWSGGASRSPDVELFRTVQDIKISPEWRRYGISVPSPKCYEGEIRLSVSGVDTVEIGGLQMEKIGEHPNYSIRPTPWMPGMTEWRNETPEIPAPLFASSGERGTIVLTVKLKQSSWIESDDAQYQLLALPGYYSIGIPVSRIGKTRIPAKALAEKLNDGQTHQVALSWDGKTAWLLVDGNVIGHARQTHPVPACNRSGLTLLPFPDFSWHSPPHGTLRQVEFYSDSLSADELKSLASNPVGFNEDNIRLERPILRTFYRDETAVNWEMGVRLPKSNSSSWRVVLENFPHASARLENDRLIINFNPSCFSPGDVEFSVVLKSTTGISRTFRRMLRILPSRPRDAYHVINWPGNHLCDDEKLLWYKDMGISTICGGLVTPDYQEKLAAMGLFSWYRTHIIPKNPHPLASKCRAEVIRESDNAAFWIRNYPWMQGVILNSESYGEGNVSDSAEAMEMMRKKFHINNPPLKSGRGGENLSIRPRLDLKCFATSGVVSDDYLPLRYLLWLLSEGDGFAETGRTVRDRIRKQAPWVEFLIEPSFEFPGRPDWADILAQWHYPEDNALIVGKWKNTQDRAIQLGLKFCPVVGLTYDTTMRWILDEKGKRLKQVVPSPDMAAANLWLTLGFTHNLFYLYGLEKYGPGKDQRWIRAYFYERIQTVLKQLRNLGPVVGPLPGKKAKLAIYSGFTNRAGLGAEQNWHIYDGALYELRAELARNGVPYDMLFEEKISAGMLKNYKYLYLPYMHYLNEKSWEIISAWRKDGGKLLMDKQSNPALQTNADEIIDILNPGKPYLRKAEFNAWSIRIKQLDSNPEVIEGQIHLLGKDAGAANIWIVVNNAWQETHAPVSIADGASDIVWDQLEDQKGNSPVVTKLKFNKPLMDTGMKQTVKLRFPVSGHPPVVYSMDTRKQLNGVQSDDGLIFDLPLEPGQGRVLAVLPRRIECLRLELVPAVPERGKTFDLNISILDGMNRIIPADSGVELKVTMPDGKLFDASAVYRLSRGKTGITLTLPYDAIAGEWRIVAECMASGIMTERHFTINQ